MIQEVKPAYSGSEVDFPTATGMLCHSCLTNLKVFSAQKPKYTREFIQEILDRSKAASLIPNIEQRQAHSTALNKEVAGKAGICADNFLALFNYMESAFSEAALPGMKKLAGGTYYDTARKSWVDTDAMNGMMLTFIDTYNTELTNAGMPASFHDKCAENSVVFSAAFQLYEDYKGIAEQQRQDKVNANNGVYKSLKGIMKDGKYIYRKDEATRKQFTWSVILSKITNNKRSGFTIKVNAPEEGRIVTTAELRLTGYTPFRASVRGIITAKVPEGMYTGVITAPGYLPLTVTFVSSKGVTHREEVTLAIAVANAG